MGSERMHWFAGSWLRVLIGLLPIGLLLIACSSADGVSETTGVDTPQGEPTSAGNLDAQSATLSYAFDSVFTINVDLTDEGIQLSSIFIPVGREIQIVLRNRGTTEHHYRVVGLMPTDLSWLAEPEGTQAEGVTDEDHDLHHSAALVPWWFTSPAGIQPRGDEVHGYAARGGLDVVHFVATNVGTFEVQCPLHPEETGTVTVF